MYIPMSQKEIETNNPMKKMWKVMNSYFLEGEHKF